MPARELQVRDGAVLLSEVRFPSGGLQLSAQLRVPEKTESRCFPGLVLCGPLTSPKDQVTGRYAELLAQSGIATLAFDPRNFGESEGLPRQHENPRAKVDDLRAAVTWLQSRLEIDAGRIGLTGVCFGSGPALQAASLDPRVRAVACVAPVFDHAPHVRAVLGPERWRAWLENLVTEVREEQRSGVPRYVPIVAADALPPWSREGSDVAGEIALMWSSGALEYFGTGRNVSKLWENRCTLASHFEILAFNPVPALEVLDDIPLLFVQGTEDQEFGPSALEEVLARAPVAPTVVSLDGWDHYDFFDQSSCIEAAIGAVAQFFAEALALAGT